MRYIYSHIGFNIAAGIFTCQAAYTLFTNLESDKYLEPLQIALLFCILSALTKISSKLSDGTR